MYIYIAVKETAETEEGEFSTYGIRCYDLDSGNVAAEIRDVFCDKRLAEQFAEKCSSEMLEPVHLSAAAEDAVWSAGTAVLIG